MLKYFSIFDATVKHSRFPWEQSRERATKLNFEKRRLWFRGDFSCIFLCSQQHGTLLAVPWATILERRDEYADDDVSTWYVYLNLCLYLTIIFSLYNRKILCIKDICVLCKITLLVIVDYSPHKLRSIGSLIEGQRWVKSLKTPHFWQSKCSEIYTVDVRWKSVNVCTMYIALINNEQKSSSNIHSLFLPL